jgi:hypothetical protein
VWTILYTLYRSIEPYKYQTNSAKRGKSEGLLVGKCVGVSPSLNPVRRNMFLISRFATLVTIGLQKPYALSESGAYRCLLTCCADDGYFLRGSKYLEYISRIRLIGMQIYSEIHNK